MPMHRRWIRTLLAALAVCLLAGPVLPGLARAVPTISIGDGEGAPGEVVSLPAGTRDITDIEAVLWDLVYDPSVLEPVEVLPAPGFPTGWALESNLDLRSDTIRIVARRLPSLPTNGPFEGDPVEVRFRIRPGAADGMTTIFIEDGSSVGTIDDEFDAPDTLFPRDGEVTVMPEPGQPLLLATGLAALAACHRLRTARALRRSRS